MSSLTTQLTDTQISALAPTDGTIVYDTTNGQYQLRQNNAWVALISAPTANFFFGSNGLPVTAIGEFNCGFGLNVMTGNGFGGNGNTGIGYNALQENLNSYNTSVGYTAGSLRVSYLGCTFLGANADSTASGLSYSSAIGYNASFSKNNIMALGAPNGFTGTVSVVIGATTNDANNTAQLAMYSTTQGLLPPVMTQAQRLAITSPAEGLMVYDTTNHSPYFFNGTAWVAF